MCWHRWVVKEKEVLPSLLEQMAAAGGGHSEAYELGHKPCIVTYRCEKCGAEKVRRI